MLKEGDKLICKTKGLPETEFCIRGVVKSVVGDKVTISRALKFGQLPMDEDLTLPEEELLKYYTLMDESELRGHGFSVWICFCQRRVCCCRDGVGGSSYNRAYQLVR